MKKKLKFIIKYALLLGIIVLIGLVFIPRKYDVPKHQPLKQIRFWELTTGSKIGYTLLEASEPKQKFPIIYLHGGPGGCINQAIINTLAPFAKEGYDVYLYDQIGGGHSDRLEHIAAYTVERHLNDLEEIVTRIGSQKVIFIGQSWGTILATLFVTKHPQLIEKIILTGPGPILPINRNMVSQKAPDSLHLVAPIFSNQDGNKKANNLRMKFVRWWASVFEEKLAKDREVDDFFTYLNNALNKSTVCDTAFVTKSKGGAGYYAHIMTLKSFKDVINLRPKMKTIQTPILLMRGQCDNQKWGFTKEYLDVFQNASLQIIPNAGHFIAVEQQELCTRTIIDFLHQ